MTTLDDPRSETPVGKTQQHRGEIRDGMRIDWDVPITMDDGLVLRADIFRPIRDGRYPVILSYGPYGKGLAFQDGYPSAWQRMAEQYPDVTAGSSNLYQSWEVVDPEKWVLHNYACMRVDSRGCGCSPGFIDHFSPRETKDFYDCIEWAGVGLVERQSRAQRYFYYAINQWHVATLQPRISPQCAWEGGRLLRDMTRHGGMLCTFWENWYDVRVKTVQYGAGECGRRSRAWGALRTRNALRSRACEEPGRPRRRHPPTRSMTRITAPVPHLDEGEDPLLSAANWGDNLHPGESCEGFMHARPRGQVAQAHGIGTGPISTRTTAASCSCGFRSFPAWKEQRFRETAACPVADAAYRWVRRTRRK
jgi:predicted acyl esterase